MILPIYKNRIPYQFEYKHNDTVFTMEIHYNSEYDFFTIDLSKRREPIMFGEKLVYNQKLFQSLSDVSLPNLIPLDPSGKENAITYDNFCETVFLQVMDNAI